MSNLALYRKYRPKSFGEVLGQDHIVGILKNAVKLNRVSHAYLFAGPAGTGKTSVARILAKEAGCSDIDLNEIDAASSRGIDEIRALREAVRFVPLQGKIKVYIIDEVHMLTKEAFNALLKTLEEPPKHVIFILATTETEKIPSTIISRCQNFTFRKIPESVIQKSITATAQEEGFKIDEEAAGLISLFAEGSFRNAQGTLDQILSLGDKNKDKKITGKEVRGFLLVPSQVMTEEFVSVLAEKDLEKGISLIQQAIEQNLDLRVFLKLILRDIRGMLLIRLAPKLEKQFAETLGESELKFLKEKAKVFKQGELERALKILLDTYDTRARAYLPQLPLELALIKILNI